MRRTAFVVLGGWADSNRERIICDDANRDLGVFFGLAVLFGCGSRHLDSDIPDGFVKYVWQMVVQGYFERDDMMGILLKLQ